MVATAAPGHYEPVVRVRVLRSQSSGTPVTPRSDSSSFLEPKGPEEFDGKMLVSFYRSQNRVPPPPRPPAPSGEDPSRCALLADGHLGAPHRPCGRPHALEGAAAPRRCHLPVHRDSHEPAHAAQRLEAESWDTRAPAHGERQRGGVSCSPGSSQDLSGSLCGTVEVDSATATDMARTHAGTPSASPPAIAPSRLERAACHAEPHEHHLARDYAAMRLAATPAPAPAAAAPAAVCVSQRPRPQLQCVRQQPGPEPELHSLRAFRSQRVRVRDGHLEYATEGDPVRRRVPLADCVLHTYTQGGWGPSPFAVALELTGSESSRGTGEVWYLIADGDADRDRLIVAICSQQRSAGVRTRSIENLRALGWAHRRRPLQATPSAEDFEFLCVLGRGSFGSVCKVREKRTRRIFACKVVRKKALSTASRVRSLLRERAVLGSLSHPFVSRLHAAFQSEGRLFMLFDFLSGGDLYHHITTTYTAGAAAPHFPEERARFYAAELALAIDYLHSLRIAHRDVKAENVVLSQAGHVALTDFGFACTFPADGGLLSERVGTAPYMAPEIASLPAEYGAGGSALQLPPEERLGYTHDVDWWAYGVLCFLMLTGVYPFWAAGNDGLCDDDALAVEIQTKDITPEALPPEPRLTPAAADFVCRLLVKQQSGRQRGADAVRAAAWMQDVDWEETARGTARPPFVPSARGSDVKYFPGAGGPDEAVEEAGLSVSGGWENYLTKGSPPDVGFRNFATLSEAAASMDLAL